MLALRSVGGAGQPGGKAGILTDSNKAGRANLPAFLFLFPFINHIHHNPLVAIRQFADGVENKPANCRGFVVHDFVGSISRAMIILMDSTEVENGRDAAFSKVVVV